jgi:beta-lactamase class D
MNKLTGFFLAFLCLQAHAAEWTESPEVAALFTSAGVTGTFVVYDIDADRYLGYNRSRAETRFVPASTFKIANTMIGLAVGAVENVDEVLPYGGAPQPFRSWERDMSLREAIALSNATIYRVLARRIGLERMRKNVAELQYGNADIGTRVDTFWLEGPLEISAVEQTRFLARLVAGDLPFPQDVQRVTREIVRLEQGEDWTLYGKTGWMNAPGSGVGWWVGWIEKDERIYTFALNIDILKSSDAGKRIELGKASFEAVGVR